MIIMPIPHMHGDLPIWWTIPGVVIFLASMISGFLIVDWKKAFSDDNFGMLDGGTDILIITMLSLAFGIGWPILLCVGALFGIALGIQLAWRKMK